MSFETKSKLEVFKNYYSCDNLFKNLPTLPNKHTYNSVIQYYRHVSQTDDLHLSYTMDITVLSKPISKLWDLFIKIGRFTTLVRLQS